MQPGQPVLVDTNVVIEAFCVGCWRGFAASETVDSCPRCASPIRNQAEVALIDSFEAEENTQITSAEDSRQRLNFRRGEHLLDNYEGEVNIGSSRNRVGKLRG